MSIPPNYKITVNGKEFYLSDITTSIYNTNGGYTLPPLAGPRVDINFSDDGMTPSSYYISPEAAPGDILSDDYQKANTWLSTTGNRFKISGQDIFERQQANTITYAFPSAPSRLSPPGVQQQVTFPEWATWVRVILCGAGGNGGSVSQPEGASTEIKGGGGGEGGFGIYDLKIPSNCGGKGVIYLGIGGYPMVCEILGNNFTSTPKQVCPRQSTTYPGAEAECGVTFFYFGEIDTTFNYKNFTFYPPSPQNNGSVYSVCGGRAVGSTPDCQGGDAAGSQPGSGGEAGTTINEKIEGPKSNFNGISNNNSPFYPWKQYTSLLEGETAYFIKTHQGNNGNAPHPQVPGAGGQSYANSDPMNYYFRLRSAVETTLEEGQGTLNYFPEPKNDFQWGKVGMSIDPGPPSTGGVGYTPFPAGTFQDAKWGSPGMAALCFYVGKPPALDWPPSSLH